MKNKLIADKDEVLDDMKAILQTAAKESCDKVPSALITVCDDRRSLSIFAFLCEWMHTAAHILLTRNCC